MQKPLINHAKSTNETCIEIALRSYASLIDSAQELAEAWDTMAEEEQVLQRAFVMSDWSKRHELGACYRAHELSPAQIKELARLDHTLLEQAAAIEIAYGPSLWQLVRNLLTWGTPLSEEEGSVQMAVPVAALSELAKHFAR
jgi:hypothetical protein